MQHVNGTTVVPFERLNKNDSLLLILDLQTGLYGLARDFDPTLYYNNMIAHAAIGRLFDIPVILSTSAQNGPNGNLPKEMLGRSASLTASSRAIELRTLLLEALR